MLLFEALLKLFLTITFLAYSKTEYSLELKTIYFMLSIMVIWVFREPFEYLFELLKEIDSNKLYPQNNTQNTPETLKSEHNSSYTQQSKGGANV